MNLEIFKARSCTCSASSLVGTRTTPWSYGGYLGCIWKFSRFSSVKEWENLQFYPFRSWRERWCSFWLWSTEWILIGLAWGHCTHFKSKPVSYFLSVWARWNFCILWLWCPSWRKLYLCLLAKIVDYLFAGLVGIAVHHLLKLRFKKNL